MPKDDLDLDAELDAIAGVKKTAPTPVAKPPPPGSNAAKYKLTKPAIVTPAMEEKYKLLVENFKKMCDVMVTRAEEAKKAQDIVICNSYANVARELAEQISVLEFMRVSSYDLPPYKAADRQVLKNYNIPSLEQDQIIIAIDSLAQSQAFQLVPGAKIKFKIPENPDFICQKSAVGSWRKEGGFTSSLQLSIKFDRTDYRKLCRSIIPLEIGIKMLRGSKPIGTAMIPLTEFATRANVVLRSLNVLQERKPITTVSVTVGMRMPLDPKCPVDRRYETIQVPNIGLERIATGAFGANSPPDKGGANQQQPQQQSLFSKTPEGYSDNELLYSTKFINECFSPALLDQGRKEFKRMREMAGHDIGITKKLTDLEELCRTKQKDIIVAVQSMHMKPAELITKINFAMEFSRLRLEDYNKKGLAPPASLKNRVEIMQKDIVHFKRNYKVTEEELKAALREYVMELKKTQAQAQAQEQAQAQAQSQAQAPQKASQPQAPPSQPSSTTGTGGTNGAGTSTGIKPLFPYPQPKTLVGIQALEYTIEDLSATKSKLPQGSAAEIQCSKLLAEANSAKQELESLTHTPTADFTTEVYVFALARCAKREEAAIKTAKNVRCNDISVTRCEKRQTLFLKELKEVMASHGIKKLVPQQIPARFAIADYIPNAETLARSKAAIVTTPRTGPFIPFPDVKTIWSSDCLNMMLKYGIQAEEIQQRIDSFEALVDDPEFDVVIYCAMMYKCMSRERIAIKAAEDMGVDDKSVEMAKERLEVMRKEFEATLEEMELTKEEVAEKAKTCAPMPPYVLNE